MSGMMHQDVDPPPKPMTIKERVASWVKEHRKMLARHELECVESRSGLRDIQRSCPHPKTEHFSDPAGGSGYTECCECGVEL